MKTAFVIIPLALCAFLAGCVSFNSHGGTVLNGSGNVVAEVRQLSQFDRVRVSGAGQLTLVQGDRESLQIEADDNLLPLIKSEVAGGVLKIGAEDVSIKPSRKIRYRLELKSIKDLQLSGSLEAEAQALQADRLRIGISGSGEVGVAKLEASRLEVQVSGSGNVKLAGKVNRQVIQISGSGDYRAGDCESQNTEVHVSGSGSATVWAQAALEVHVSGSGQIRYYGKPRVDSSVSGSGGIRSLGAK